MLTGACACTWHRRTFSHRLKSVSQAIFTPDEVAQVAAGGNVVRADGDGAGGFRALTCVGL
jgi:hypothetical protein